MEYGGHALVTIENVALHPSHQPADLPVSCKPFVGTCGLSVSELLGCWGDNEVFFLLGSFFCWFGVRR